MQFKETSDKDTCSDLLLPLLTDETGREEQTAPATNNDIGVNDGKSTLTDVPLTLEKLAMIHNRPISPLYKGDLSLNGVWSTKISQEYPGKPMMISQNKRRRGVFRLLRLLIIALGVYYCSSATYTLVMNARIAQKLRSTLYESLKLVEPVEVINDIPTEYEGKLIHVVGRISVPVPLSYEECGVFARSIKVKRVYDKSREINRAEFEPYIPGDSWLNMPQIKEKFCDDGYVYQEKVVDDEQIADVARIGPLELSDQIKKKFDSYSVIREKLRSISWWNAYRVTYSDTGRNGEKYYIMGKLVNSTIQPHELPDFTMISQRGITHKENVISDRVRDHIDTLNAENWYSYIKIGTLFPLTVILYFIGSMDATMKNKRKHVMLSMPVQ